MPFRLPYDAWNSMPTGYAFGQSTFYGTKHLGIDKGNRDWFGAKLKAPTNGKIQAKKIGTEMGLHLHFLDDRGFLWRFGHLLSAHDVGNVTIGQDIGEMGNTGLVNPAPTPQDSKQGAHTHCDISKNGILQLTNFNNFIDPAVYIAQRLQENQPVYNDKIIRNKQTGQFALVIRGKKYVFSQNLDLLALLTFFNVEDKKIFKDEIVDVENSVFTSIPDSQGLNF